MHHKSARRNTICQARRRDMTRTCLKEKTLLYVGYLCTFLCRLTDIYRVVINARPMTGKTQFLLPRIHYNTHAASTLSPALDRKLHLYPQPQYIASAVDSLRRHHGLYPHWRHLRSRIVRLFRTHPNGQAISGFHTCMISVHSHCFHPSDKALSTVLIC